MKARNVLAAGALLATLAVPAQPAWANHPVFVEGNCDSPVPGTTIVTQGTCGDFDGDGRVGTAEDTDGADRIFGTVAAALGPGTGAAAGTGANQNGRITIVGDGRFTEQLLITGANVTIEGAPGVAATIDAVLQGDPAGGNNTRQGGIGISINTPTTARTTLRNLAVRNWATGIHIQDAHVVLDDVRLEGNLNAGIVVAGAGVLTLTDSHINGTGFRIGTAASTPTGGIGLEFRDSAKGVIADSAVTGSFGAGVKDNSSASYALQRATLFDNSPNQVRV